MVIFASHLPSYTGWWAGLIAGCAVIAVAVAIVLAIITYSARVSRQMGAAILALERARRATAALGALAARRE